MNARTQAQTSQADFSCCSGRGWVLTPFDTWVKCSTHFSGQPHPEMDDYSQDVSASWVDHEERKGSYQLANADYSRTFMVMTMPGRRDVSLAYYAIDYTDGGSSSRIVYRTVSRDEARKEWRRLVAKGFKRCM